jgi:hypothetical protein
MRSFPESVATGTDVILTEMDDGTGVLLHMRTKFYYTLNATGVFVWKHLEQGRSTLDALVQALEHNFEVDATRARDDVHKLLEELLNEELVVG